MSKVGVIIIAIIIQGCASDDAADFSSLGGGRTGPRIAISSLSRKPLLPRFINSGKARKHALTYNGGDSAKILEKRLASLRVARSRFSEVQTAALQLVNLELEKSLTRSMSDQAKLEVGLSALQNKRYGLAMILFDELHRSKSAYVRAGAWTATGSIAVVEGRHPEAVLAWEKALNDVPGFVPALYNLTFMNLKFGQFSQASRRIAQLPKGWFKDSIRAVLARYNGKKSQVESLCDTLLEKQSQNKMILFNCAIHYWQNNKDLSEAKSLMQRAIRARGGEQSWNVKGRQLLNRMR